MRQTLSSPSRSNYLDPSPTGRRPGLTSRGKKGAYKYIKAFKRRVNGSLSRAEAIEAIQRTLSILVDVVYELQGRESDLRIQTNKLTMEYNVFTDVKQKKTQTQNGTIST